MRSQAEAEKFLFIPSRLKNGTNLQGYVLSHFAHAGWGHFAFNMLALFMFGAALLRHDTWISLLLLYGIAGLAADLVVYMMRKNEASYRCLGASGSVSGIVFAGIVYEPGMNIFIYFIPIPIPGPIFALLYIALSFYLMRRARDNVSHEAHIGGSLAGFVGAVLLAPQGIIPLWHRVLDLIAFSA